MPCGARCGTRPWPTAGRRGTRPWRARPTARRWRTSSRRSAALAHLPEQRDTREQAIDLRLALRTALLPLGELWAYPRRTLREAEALAEALDDPRRLGQVSAFLCTPFLAAWATYDQAIAAGQRALALATASGDVVLQALANLCLGRAYHAQGDYRRAIDCLRQTVASLDGARRHERFGQPVLPAVRLPCLARLVPCRAGRVRRGQCPRGRRAPDCRGGRAPLQPDDGVYGGRSAGPPPRRPAPGPLPLLERAVGLCQDADLPLLFPWMAAALGAAYALAGRVADAVPLLHAGDGADQSPREDGRLSGALWSPA